MPKIYTTDSELRELETYHIEELSTGVLGECMGKNLHRNTKVQKTKITTRLSLQDFSMILPNRYTGIHHRHSLHCRMGK